MPLAGGFTHRQLELPLAAVRMEELRSKQDEAEQERGKSHRLRFKELMRDNRPDAFKVWTQEGTGPSHVDQVHYTVLEKENELKKKSEVDIWGLNRETWRGSA